MTNLNHNWVRGTLRVIAELNSGDGKVVVFAAELLGVQMLKRLIIDAADRVVVRESNDAISVRVSFDHRRIADPAVPQQSSATRQLRIFFLATEPGKQ